MREFRKVLAFAGGTALVLCFLGIGLSAAWGAPAPDGNSVLILGSSVRNTGPSVEATEAAALGYTVVVASDDDWAAMSAEEFATYRAVVLGDGLCLGSTSITAAENNRDVWSAAVSGNVFVVGTHPATTARAKPDARALVRDGLRFAVDGPGTGAYVTLRCFLSSKPTEVPILKPFGRFSVVNQAECGRTASVVMTHPTLSEVTDAGLSSWKCSNDVGFLEWPADFNVVAISTSGAASYISPGGVTGSPFILARAKEMTPNAFSSDPARALITTDAGNGQSGIHFPSNDPTGEQRSTIDFAAGNTELSSPLATGNLSFHLSGSYDFYNQSFGPYEPVSGWGLGGNLRLFTSWDDPNASVTVNYESSLVRQGENPGVVDTLNPGNGDLCVGFEATVTALIAGNSIGTTFHDSICGNCPVELESSANCNIGRQNFEIVCIPLVPPVEGCLALTVGLDASVTPSPFALERTVLYDGTPGTGPNTLTFPPNPLADPFRVACLVPAGAEAVYQMANPGTDRTLDFSVPIGIAGETCEPIIGCQEIVQQDLFSIPVTSANLHLGSSTTRELSLGTVLADNKPVNLTSVNVSYSGNEGTPIQFSTAGAVDNCLDTVDFVWNFSDGGIAYGLNPFHTFQDNQGHDPWSGQLVATDLAGNRSTKAVTIQVANVSPNVNAGPDTTEAWGVPVVFNGSAADPGAGDQATLHYEWSFGDGTPSATGGPSVAHAYAAPGSYVATLHVCDKDGACTDDSRTTIVRKRNVAVGYLGDQNGVYDMLTNLSASLTDEFAVPVQGRTIDFSIGPESGGSAATSSLGIASTSHLLGLNAGTYSVTSTFAGDSLYNSAVSGAASYTVARKATTVVYTGALFGGPNKTVPLSAVLTDVEGKPLAGRLIVFQLGAQSASATTDASGVAATTLKLNQKNGAYPLTATYTPAGTDVDRYLGSVASTTFKIQVK